VAGSTCAAVAHATGSVLRSTTSLQCLELSVVFDRALMRAILDGLRANQTVLSLKFGANTRFDEEATNDFAHFIRDECNRNGNVLRELGMEMSPYMFRVSRNTSVGRVVTGMLQGSALEVLHFPGSFPLPASIYSCGAADFFRGLMDPSVFLRSLKLASLDGAGVVKQLVSFISATTTLRHLTIANLMQMHDIRSFMPACHQNGSLHSIAISHANDNCTESSAEWASSLAWFVRRTTAICNRNRKMMFLLSGCVSLDNEVPETDTTLAEVLLFPMLIRVAQQTQRTGRKAVFAGLLASNWDTIGPDRMQRKHANSRNKRLL
jgi:hypothetical protein